MAREEPMLHVPVFEKLGEEQTRLQFSNMNNDVGAQARTWLHGIEEAREKARHTELLAEIKRPHWSVIPSFYLLVLSVLLTAAGLLVALSQRPQAQSPVAVVAPSTQTTLPAHLPSANSQQQLPSSASPQPRTSRN
jgi:hypothetical protein